MKHIYSVCYVYLLIYNLILLIGSCELNYHLVSFFSYSNSFLFLPLPLCCFCEKCLIFVVHLKFIQYCICVYSYSPNNILYHQYVLYKCLFKTIMRWVRCALIRTFVILEFFQVIFYVCLFFCGFKLLCLMTFL